MYSFTQGHANLVISKATSGSIMITNSSAGPAGSISIYPESKIFLDFRQYEGVYHDFIKMKLLPEDQRGEPPGKLPFRDHTQKECPTIFICGHGGRDSRCGVMGALLRNEFQTHIQSNGRVAYGMMPEVALISHIGGHVFAGNVIIYFPVKPASHPLAGKGVWYGRVEPRHVEGILHQTVTNGMIIRELFRGGLDIDGRPLSVE